MLHTAAGLSPAAPSSQLALDQAVAAIRAGNLMEAQRLLRERLVLAPQDADILTKLAEIAMAQKRTEEATVLLRKAASADPAFSRQLALLSHLHHHVGAQSSLGQIDEFLPAFRLRYEVRAIEASALGTLGNHDQQIAIYEELAKDFPRDHVLWMSLGDAYKTVGRLEDAVRALRSAIKVCPTFGEAYWTLANFKAVRFSDRDISSMKRALASKLQLSDQLHFHFALGKAFEDKRLYAPSFKHYAEGNRLRLTQIEPKSRTVTHFVDAAIQTFDRARFERGGSRCTSSAPIFVVGLHRSGSTLIEQILASHPQIEGTTEITVMMHLWNRVTRLANAEGRVSLDEIMDLDGDALTDIGEEYIQRTRAFRSTDRPYFVDKLPANWMHLGLIRLALPNARIIDARRHPLACGFSNFRQNYASTVPFSYSLETIGQFYRDYWRFMRHFDEVQPGAVHRVLNERLIDDPEGETRAMLDFIGVPFDPGCLEFHQNKRAVATPSAEQVRRPINRDGVDSWRHYERWLGPLKQALGDALENWDKPAQST